MPVQDIRVGGRQANAQYQYTLQADDLAELRTWEPRVRQALSAAAGAGRRQHRPAGQGAADVARHRSRHRGAPRRDAAPDRRDAERRVRPAPGVDDLRAAQPVPRGDGSRARSTGRRPETLDRRLRERAERARRCRCRRSRATSRPTRRSASTTRAQFVASTISFNLPAGVSLSQATRAIDDALPQIGVPTTVRGSFQGTARAFQASLRQPAVADPGRARRGLHRARHALRELRPPDHDPLDAAVGGRRRAARAARCSAPSSRSSR